MEILKRVFPHNIKWYQFILYWLIVIIFYAIAIIIFGGPIILMYNKIKTGSIFEGFF